MRAHDRRALAPPLLLCAAVMLVDPLVASAVVTPYSPLTDAISDLAATSCTEALCSPRWPLMTVALVVSGLAFVVSGLLLPPRLGVGPGAGGDGRALRTASAALLVVAGLATVGVGLTPIDRDPELHHLLAVPIFPAQNVALLLLATQVGARAGRWRPALSTAGVLGLVASVALVAPLGVPFGLAERLAAYPAPALLAALGLRFAAGAGTLSAPP